MLHIGQKVKKVVGDSVEVVGLTASPLMGIVIATLGKIVSSVCSFARQEWSELKQPSTPEYLSNSVRDEILDSLYNEQRSAAPAAVKPAVFKK